jgi:single-strand DNA-binding protein
MNFVILRGQLSSQPQERVLASGSVLWSLELTTPTDQGAWSVPVAWFDPPVAVAFDAGDEVVVVGAVRRRFFRSAAGTQSRTEVVASDVVSATARRKVDRVVQRELDRLGAHLGGALRSV